VVHRESIIHSMVEYIDNSIIAQMSVPDMRLCVQYAVSYPDRTISTITELDLFEQAYLSFKKPDMETFPLLKCAYDCIKKGGALPAVLNAANEVAVGKFLKKEISFYDVFESVCETVDRLGDAAGAHTLDKILYYDVLARETAQKILM